MRRKSGSPERTAPAGRGVSRALVAAGLAALAAAFPLRAQETSLPDRVQERIRGRLESVSQSVPAAAVGPLRASGERLYASDALAAFYEGRTFRPAWIGEAGGPTPGATALVRALRRAAAHGLRPADYHVPAIDSALAARREGRSAGSARELAQLDLL
ncbi:MAG: hypothetical protein ABEJ46_00845, partial [Gemmatimonadota bacterium]